MTLILVLDVGNTSTMLGVLDGERMVHTWRIRTDPRTTDELGSLLLQLLAHRGVEPDALVGAMGGVVVPSMRYAVEEACRRYLDIECRFVGQGTRTGMKLRVQNPREVGADRIANAVGALHRWGGPVVVVDLGSATTVDAVNGQGEFVGGVIAPGFRVAGEALFAHAAQLPRVELAPPTGGVIGRNTQDAVQAGLFHGFVGLVDHLAAQVRAALAPDDDPGSVRVVATGDYATLFQEASREIGEVDRLLTLRGLGLLHERNPPRRP